MEERDLRGWKLLARFDELLERARAKVEPGPREAHGLRRLGAGEYLRLFLLGMFNPLITSRRGLGAATALARVRRTASGGAVALSRFSEAQHVFDPELLRRVMAELVEAGAAQAGANCGGINPAALRVIDSTLWKVVPRMGWAQYGGGRGGRAQGVRLHLKLRVSDDAPAEARITAGKGCERAALRERLREGEIYLGDRYYGEDYGLLEEIEARGCGFLLRLRKSAVVHWQKEESLSAADTAAGVVQAGQAALGAREKRGPWRVVRIERAGQEPVVLVASACFGQMSAAEIGALYRQRWQVELFFRWLKCLLPCRHWLAESERGVNFQIYLALICALLLAEASGRRPGKRVMELLAFPQMGWASDEELGAGLERELREQAARRRRRQKAKA